MRLLLPLTLVAVLVTSFACGDDPAPPPPPDGTTDAGTPRPPPPLQCDPACSPTQKCEKVGEEAVCIEICNAPHGCYPGFEVCNTETAECEPITCNGAQCERGQTCVDPSRSDFPRDGEAAVCSCTPAYRTGQVEHLDSCNAYGMVCAFNRATRAPASCVMPGEGDPCIPSIGCDQTGVTLECRSIGSSMICARKCSSADECPLATDTCAPSGFCEPNLCARRQDGSLDRSKLFGPCDARGTGDGTCLPRRIRGSDSALCVQNGTADVGDECSPEATRAEADKLCGAGQVCEGIQPDPTHPNRTRGICARACNASTGMQASPRIGCDPGSRCRAIADGSNFTRLGACTAECDLIGGTDGCPDDALGNEVGCYSYSNRNADTGWCLPIHPNAGTANTQSCADVGGGDARQSCGSRMSCVGRSAAACFQYCDLRLCPKANEPCPHCDESAPRCARTGNDNNAQVGVCTR